MTKDERKMIDGLWVMITQGQTVFDDAEVGFIYNLKFKYSHDLVLSSKQSEWLGSIWDTYTFPLNEVPPSGGPPVGDRLNMHVERMNAIEVQIAKVVVRIRNVEQMIRELRGQLDGARAAAQLQRTGIDKLEARMIAQEAATRDLYKDRI